MFTTQAVEAALEPRVPDIWADDNALYYLRHGVHIRPDLPAAEVKRITRRVASYRMERGLVHRQMPDGSWRHVPSPLERAGIIRKWHNSTGHFGVRRTLHLVALSHWWYGMSEDVSMEVRRCPECDRVRVGLSSERP